jgi:hypothetical protein
MKNENSPLLSIYTITASDLGLLLKEIPANDLSPYLQMTAAISQEDPSSELTKLMNSPHEKIISRLLGEPDLRIRFHAGGSVSQEEIYYVLLSARISQVLAQFTDSENRLKLLLFSDWQGFLDWWSALYGSSENHSYREIFPGTQDLETLVCAFHCLDTYRRAYLEAMLRYEGVGEVTRSSRDFIVSLKEAIVKGDNRWLLPSFINLTPGLKTQKIVLEPEHLDILEVLGFLKKNQTGEGETLTIGQLGVTLGTEFAASWMGSVGFEAVTLINGKRTVLDRKFLMPTAFTNHLVSLENENGELKFQHQALDSDHLIKLLNEWMGYLKKIAFKIPTIQEKPPTVRHFCHKCGSPLKTGSKFCTKCGTPVV